MNYATYFFPSIFLLLKFSFSDGYKILPPNWTSSLLKFWLYTCKFDNTFTRNSSKFENYCNQIHATSWPSIHVAYAGHFKNDPNLATCVSTYAFRHYLSCWQTNVPIFACPANEAKWSCSSSSCNLRFSNLLPKVTFQVNKNCTNSIIIIGWIIKTYLTGIR